VLEPRPGERVLEIGPGTGYYTLDLAEWLGDEGVVEIFDIQQEMLDHTLQRAADRGVRNLIATRGDAAELPYEDGSIDAVVLVAVLGEIPERERAMAEIARVLRPGGRLVVGELIGDPHFTTAGALEHLGGAVGLTLEERSGPSFGYFARLRR
jgi:ubiquinone/menaquinone biosynthesis C-methylase UbiE